MEKHSERRNRSSRSSFPAEQSAKKKARETRQDEREVHPNYRSPLRPSSSVRPLWKRSSSCQEEYSAGRAIIGETNANKRDCSHCVGPSGRLPQPASRAIAEAVLFERNREGKKSFPLILCPFFSSLSFPYPFLSIFLPLLLNVSLCSSYLRARVFCLKHTIAPLCSSR